MEAGSEPAAAASPCLQSVLCATPGPTRSHPRVSAWPPRNPQVEVTEKDSIIINYSGPAGEPRWSFRASCGAPEHDTARIRPAVLRRPPLGAACVRLRRPLLPSSAAQHLPAARAVHQPLPVNTPTHPALPLPCPARRHPRQHRVADAVLCPAIQQGPCLAQGQRRHCGACPPPRTISGWGQGQGRDTVAGGVAPPAPARPAPTPLQPPPCARSPLTRRLFSLSPLSITAEGQPVQPEEAVRQGAAHRQRQLHVDPQRQRRPFRLHHPGVCGVYVCVRACGGGEGRP